MYYFFPPAPPLLPNDESSCVGLTWYFLIIKVALSKYPNIDVDIYEAATEFSEVGAGIGIWPRVWRLLAKLGLDEELAGVSALQPTDEEGESATIVLLKTVPAKGGGGGVVQVDTFIFRKADQPEGLDFYTLRTRGELESTCFWERASQKRYCR